MLSGKNIVLGISGGIAAYKAADLISRLKKKNASVFVVMTEAATHFITPLTLQTLSQNPVSVSVFDEPVAWEVNHVSLADKADVFAVVPATANIIGKLAYGIADDMLTTTALAMRCPKIAAPAMNTAMFQNKIVVDNIEKLKEAGYEIIEPRVSRLACGAEGKGALAELDLIEAAICRAAKGIYDLKGKKVLVTAGPTMEEIDPVRFITNHSSGKMGYAVAKAAYDRGAEVTLVSGEVNIPAPYGTKVIKVKSAEDMYNAVMAEYENADIIVKAAAVGDFKVKNKNQNKIKKDQINSIELEKNKDILAALGQVKGDRVLVGFCMETQNLIANAEKKLISKNADMIIANNLTDKGAGFGTDTNTVTIISKDGTEQLPNMSKEAVADIILTKALKVRDEA